MYSLHGLLALMRAVWDLALESGRQHGYRNAQATVLAPTGTIGFMMDCDTTGIEPDIALIKYKRLVGGGMIKIVNNTITEALAHLGEGHIAYVKQIRSEDVPGLFPQAPTIAPGLKLFALHAADGTPIMLTDSREAAVANAWSNELQAVSVH